MRPQEHEYPSYYSGYVARVPEEGPIVAIEKATTELNHFLPQLPEGKADYRYGDNKWTVKEVLQHTIDTERIMAYRALVIARGDTTALPGFDENSYARVANTEHRTLAELTSELVAVRKSSLFLFQSFDEAAYRRQGIANNNPVSVLGIAYILVGHQRHHFAILQERYFPELQLA